MVDAGSSRGSTSSRQSASPLDSKLTPREGPPMPQLAAGLPDQEIEDLAFRYHEQAPWLNMWSLIQTVPALISRMQRRIVLKSWV